MVYRSTKSLLDLPLLLGYLHILLLIQSTLLYAIMCAIDATAAVGARLMGLFLAVCALYFALVAVLGHATDVLVAEVSYSRALKSSILFVRVLAIFL